jgi:hypothetical protein
VQQQEREEREQQQQQQQQQQRVVWPASCYAYGPSIFSRVDSSSFGYGHFAGTFIPATCSSSATQQQQQQQQQDTAGGSVSVHAWAQVSAAAAAAGGFAGGPLLSTPVLPTYPMPLGSNAADSSSSSTFQEQQQQVLCKLQQQHSLQSVVALNGGLSWGPNGEGPKLLIKSKIHWLAQQQQQQQQQQQEEGMSAAAAAAAGGGGEVLPTGLLVSQHTTAEEVEAGEREWVWR